MDKESYFDGIIDRKTFSVMKVFIKKPGSFFHITKVSDESKVPSATAFRIIKKLSKIGFLDKTMVGKLALYKLSGCDKARFFEKILK